MRIEVGEQDEGPAVLCWLRRQFLMRFADETQCVTLKPVTDGLAQTQKDGAVFFLASAKKSVRASVMSTISRSRWRSRSFTS